MSYHQYSEDVGRAVDRVARTFKLSTTDAEDLHSDVWIKLLDRQGRVLRGFDGESSVGTYLTSVARNLLLDRRNKEWGKWRPSRAALRAGPAAVMLDRLISRDGLSLDSAAQLLTCANLTPKHTSIASLAHILPVRRRRRFVNAEVLESLPTPEPSPHDVCCTLERTVTARHVRAAMATALRKLSRGDRQLLIWRFVDGRTIAGIAAFARLDVRALYRRYSRILRRLRRDLEVAGVDVLSVRAMLTDGSRHSPIAV